MKACTASWTCDIMVIYVSLVVNPDNGRTGPKFVHLKGRCPLRGRPIHPCSSLRPGTFGWRQTVKRQIRNRDALVGKTSRKRQGRQRAQAALLWMGTGMGQAGVLCDPPKRQSSSGSERRLPPFPIHFPRNSRDSSRWASRLCSSDAYHDPESFLPRLTTSRADGDECRSQSHPQGDWTSLSSRTLYAKKPSTSVLDVILQKLTATSEIHWYVIGHK